MGLRDCGFEGLYLALVIYGYVGGFMVFVVRWYLIGFETWIWVWMGFETVQDLVSYMGVHGLKFVMDF